MKLGFRSETSHCLRMFSEIHAVCMRFGNVDLNLRKRSRFWKIFNISKLVATKRMGLGRIIYK